MCAPHQTALRSPHDQIPTTPLGRSHPPTHRHPPPQKHTRNAGTASAQSFPTFAQALNQPQLSKLKGIVDTLSLQSTFSNPQLKVTAFVPTDTAFNAALAKYPVASSFLSNRSIVQQVLYFHLLKEVVKAPLPSKTYNTFLSGRTLQTNGMQVTAAGSSAKITKPNVACGAGLAHEIDNVLLFIDVTSFAGLGK